MTTPQFILTWRLATVVITIVVVLLIALGSFGIGPLAGLLGPSAPHISI
jgi:hypothetical protein